MIYPRDLLLKIKPYLGEDTIIVIHGARQLGKTHLLYLIAKELEQKKQPFLYIDLEDPLLLETLNKGADSLIEYSKGEGHPENQKLYILIDEIQYLENPSSLLKMIADHHKWIHLVVSGSSTFAIKSKFTDSLAGRTVDFVVYPLSFREFLTFRKIDIQVQQATSPIHIKMLTDAYREYVRYGGYPKIVLTDSIEKKEVFLKQIIDTYIRKDIRDLGRIQDIEKFNKLLIVLAAQSGTLLNSSRLSKELRLSIQTVEKYLLLLQETYIIRLVSPYSKSPHVEVVKAPKIFFYDSGIATLLWMKNFPHIVVGSAFETSIFSELVKEYGVENVLYWRTKAKQEIDFILTSQKGATQHVLPIEAKLNGAGFRKGAVSSFNTRYGIYNYRLVCLEGTDGTSTQIYPWQLADEGIFK